MGNIAHYHGEQGRVLQERKLRRVQSQRCHAFVGLNPRLQDTRKKYCIVKIVVVCVTLSALQTTEAIPQAPTAYDVAFGEIANLLQQGNDESACSDLADTLETEVTNTVDNVNKSLQALDDGADCPSEGQEAVATAEGNKDITDKAAADAALAAALAADVKVDFGTYSFRSLNEEECTEFWNDDAYIAAKKADASAKDTQLQDDAAAKAAAEAVEAATEAAAKAVKSCQCATRKAYNKGNFLHLTLFL